MYTVYKHTSPNGKVYIGITGGNVNKRWRKNGKGYINNKYFTRAIKKYGWENFNHEILFEGLTKKQACEMEQHLIEKYDCIMPKGYNKSKGGECGAFGVKQTEEAKKNKSKIMKEYYKNNPRSKETNERISYIHKTNKKCINHWNKVLKKIHETPVSEKTRKKISEANKNPSEETRKKISKAQKGRKGYWKGKHLSEETRKKISKAQKGKHLSEETRKKMKGRTPWNKGKKGTTKLTKEQHDKIQKASIEARARKIINIETGEKFNTIVEASNIYCISFQNIHKVCNGKRKTAGGYHWKYVD